MIFIHKWLNAAGEFVPAVPPSAYGEELPLAVQAGTVAIIRKVRKRVFLRHFVLKTMILSRQARDKHWENSKQEMRFLIGVLAQRLAKHIWKAPVRKRSLFPLFMLQIISLPRQARDTRRPNSKKRALFTQVYAQAGGAPSVSARSLTAYLGTYLPILGRSRGARSGEKRNRLFFRWFC